MAGLGFMLMVLFIFYAGMIVGSALVDEPDCSQIEQEVSNDR